MDDEPTEVEAKDPIQILQDAIAQVAEPGSFCAGFVLACEWLEESGQTTLQLFHSPMPPWHLSGLLEYARASHCAPLVQVMDVDWEDDDDY